MIVQDHNAKELVQTAKCGTIEQWELIKKEVNQSILSYVSDMAEAFGKKQINIQQGIIGYNHNTVEILSTVFFGYLLSDGERSQLLKIGITVENVLGHLSEDEKNSIENVYNKLFKALIEQTQSAIKIDDCKDRFFGFIEKTGYEISLSGKKERTSFLLALLNDLIKLENKEKYKQPASQKKQKYRKDILKIFISSLNNLIEKVELSSKEALENIFTIRLKQEKNTKALEASNKLLTETIQNFDILKNEIAKKHNNVEEITRIEEILSIFIKFYKNAPQDNVEENLTPYNLSIQICSTAFTDITNFLSQKEVILNDKTSEGEKIEEYLLSKINHFKKSTNKKPQAESILKLLNSVNDLLKFLIKSDLQARLLEHLTYYNTFYRTSEYQALVYFIEQIQKIIAKEHEFIRKKTMGSICKGFALVIDRMNLFYSSPNDNLPSDALSPNDNHLGSDALSPNDNLPSDALSPNDNLPSDPLSPNDNHLGSDALSPNQNNLRLEKYKIFQTLKPIEKTDEFGEIKFAGSSITIMTISQFELENFCKKVVDLCDIKTLQSIVSVLDVCFFEFKHNNIFSHFINCISIFNKVKKYNTVFTHSASEQMNEIRKLYLELEKLNYSYEQLKTKTTDLNILQAANQERESKVLSTELRMKNFIETFKKDIGIKHMLFSTAIEKNIHNLEVMIYHQENTKNINKNQLDHLFEIRRFVEIISELVNNILFEIAEVTLDNIIPLNINQYKLLELLVDNSEQANQKQLSTNEEKTEENSIKNQKDIN